MDGAVAGALSHLRQGAGDQVTEQEELQKRIRRNALLLGLLAVAVYVVYYLIEFAR